MLKFEIFYKLKLVSSWIWTIQLIYPSFLLSEMVNKEDSGFVIVYH